jgi:ABC-type dipeptide/oligopeptide/nickel transport system permease subunit
MTRGSGVLIAAAGALVLLIIGAAFAPALEVALGVSHTAVDLDARFASPAWPHLLGCDELGRDVFVRLLMAARTSLTIGVGCALLATMLGGLVGLVGAWNPGPLDRALAGVTDAALSVPGLPLMLLLSASTTSTAARTGEVVVRIVLLVSALAWMTIARLTRAIARRALSEGHVEAARALGGSVVRIAAHHIWPSLRGPLFAFAALELGAGILAEASLSFLGLGIRPPTPSWGTMLASALDHGSRAPHMLVFPGLIACATVAACGAWARRLGADR